MPDEEVPRDRWGRAKIAHPVTGVLTPYARASSFGDVLDDHHNLDLWKQRKVAEGLTARPDLVMSFAAAGADKTRGNQICASAIEAAGGSARATVGTALHTFTERLDRGEPLGPLPAEFKADLAAYERATSALRAVEIERFIVEDEYQIAGTFDRLYEVDGQLFIGDVKTGSIYGRAKITVQLAAYAHGKFYDPSTRIRQEMPATVSHTRGIVVHLPQGEGTCDLYWADLAHGWVGVDLASRVKTYRKSDGPRGDLFSPYRAPLKAAA